MSGWAIYLIGVLFVVALSLDDDMPPVIPSDFRWLAFPVAMAWPVLCIAYVAVKAIGRR